MCPSSLNQKLAAKYCSPDFNSVDYSVRGHCTRWHGHKILGNDHLKCTLIERWAQLILDTLIPAVDQLPQRLVLVINAKVAQLFTSDCI